jgi:hypothetical protein
MASNPNLIEILRISPTCDYHKVNGLYVLDEDVWIDFKLADVKFRVKVDKGAMTDGLSVPKIFRWYLKDWDDNNPLYNIAGIVHDGCYGSEVLCKEMADQLFYNALVFAQIPRRKASVALWAVEHLAGLHYGSKHDDFGISEYVSLNAIQ